MPVGDSTIRAIAPYPQLFCRRPSTAATRVNNFKAIDMASVGKVIHTDNQIRPANSKAAYAPMKTRWLRTMIRPCRRDV